MKPAPTKCAVRSHPELRDRVTPLPSGAQGQGDWEGSVSERLTGNEMSDFSRLWYDGCVMQSSRHTMWTEITRRKYEREGRRYASDVTDGEWALIDPNIQWASPLG